MTNDTTITTDGAATHRGRLYTLLALAFDRTEEGLEDAIADGEFPAGLLESARALGDEPIVAAAELFADDEDVPEVDRLRSVYGSTFGIESSTSVSLYEIAYRPGGIVTNTDVLADIAGFYEAFGLSVGEPRDRVDHLATQLEFVGELALREAYFDDTGDEDGFEIVRDAQARFLEAHLGRWVPRFRESVTETAANNHVGPYDDVARILEALVAGDADRFGVDPAVFDAEPDGPLESLFEDDGTDWRCGTCAANPSPPNTVTNK